MYKGLDNIGGMLSKFGDYDIEVGGLGGRGGARMSTSEGRRGRAPCPHPSLPSLPSSPSSALAHPQGKKLFVDHMEAFAERLQTVNARLELTDDPLGNEILRMQRVQM